MWMKEINLQRRGKGNFILSTIKLISSREEVTVEEIDVKEKKCRTKESQFTLNLYSKVLRFTKLLSDVHSVC